MYVMQKLFKKKNTKFYKIISDKTAMGMHTSSSKNVLEKMENFKNEMFDLNETFSFEFSINKFDQIYFNIDLLITTSKKTEALKIGKIVIGSINYCKNIKGFTQMEQMIRDTGNEISEWHKFL